MQTTLILKYLLIPFWSVMLWVTEGRAQVAVIANKSVSVETITNADLYDLYAFEVRKWKDGQPVIVFDLKQQGDTRMDFYRFLGKSPSRMKSIWLVLKLSGEGEPPEALSSEEDMIQRVVETPGAIGFTCLPIDDNRVKVLAIIDDP